MANFKWIRRGWDWPQADRALQDYIDLRDNELEDYLSSQTPQGRIVFTGTFGGSTSAATVTTIGSSTFPVIPGRRIWVDWLPDVFFGTVAGDNYSMDVSIGSAALSAGPAVIFIVSAGNFIPPAIISREFVTSSTTGTSTVFAVAQRSSGTGVLTQTRGRIRVLDVGPA